MNRCLTEKTLLLLYDEKGTVFQRDHLQECGTCSARYERLTRDLEAISQALRQPPPPDAVGYCFGPIGPRWLPATVAAAILATVLLSQIGPISNPPPSGRKGVGDAEIWAFLEGVSADLFSVNQAIAEELGVETADPDDVVIALESDWRTE